MRPKTEKLPNKVQIKKRTKKWRDTKSTDSYNRRTEATNGSDDLFTLNLKINNMTVCDCGSIYSLFLKNCPDCEVVNQNYIEPSTQ